MTNKGGSQMNLFFFLLLFLFVSSGANAVDVQKDKAVLTDEIKSGKLVLNSCGEKYLKIGDDMLDRADKSWKNRPGDYSGVAAGYDMLFFAFNSKVHYERARLCMEMSQK